MWGVGVGEGVGVYDFVSSLLFCYFCRWALVVVILGEKSYSASLSFGSLLRSFLLGDSPGFG